MMSLRSWLALLVIYVVYLVMGGFVFRALENPPSCQAKADAKDNERRMRKKIFAFSGKRDYPHTYLCLCIAVKGC